MPVVPERELSRLAGIVRLRSAELAVEVAAVSSWRRGRLADPWLVATGDAGCVCVEPRDVFRAALTELGSGVVLLHTHPVSAKPSAEDLAVTRRLVAAGVLLGVPLLAHLVVARGGVLDCLGQLARRA